MELDVIDSKNAALLVVSMQNAFVHQKSTPSIPRTDPGRLPTAVPAIKHLIDRFAMAGIPVIWMVREDFAVDPGRLQKNFSFAKRRQTPCFVGTWEAEIIDELKPAVAATPGYVLRERGAGSFYETGLELLLRKLGTRSLFIAGTKANAGVDAAIREACLRDYDVIAVTDCIYDVEEEWEQTVLKVQDRHSSRDSNEILCWLETQGRPRILGFEHMILQVADLEASKHFYLDLLGFTPRRAIPLADGRPVVPFTQGIALTAGNPGRPPQIDHMAFRVNDVRTLAQYLEAAEVRFFNKLHDGPLGLTIYVADPDGNKIELFQEGARTAD